MSNIFVKMLINSNISEHFLYYLNIYYTGNVNKL